MLIQECDYQKVRDLKVGELSTHWDFDAWNKPFSNGEPVQCHLKKIHDRLGCDLSRTNLVNFYGEADIHCVTKFIAAMVWGYGAPKGQRWDHRGPSRLKKMFTDYTVTKKIIDSIDVNGEDNIKNSYQKMKKIKYLGPNFFTKHFYFLGKSQSLNPYPLIFDARVARGIMTSLLSNLKSSTPVINFISFDPVKRPEAYLAYLRIASDEAKNIACDLENVELFFFKAGKADLD